MSATAATDHIGDYALDSELGRGAFGVVYRAHHLDRPDESVALKVVEGRGNLDQSMLEPALLSQVDHPCVVGIEDYFRDGDRLVLALEYVEGEDLRTLIDRGETFSQAQIREFLVQMAGALAAAHARQIVHRDIKPSNILVVREAGQLRFVLTDFGIGRQVEGIQDRKHTGGTYLFMAPEQLRGRPGPQSDLWALGVVAYRLLTGKLPFPGPSLAELSRQILYDSPAPPAQACAEPVDPELETVILRLLDKSLQERVSSAEELLRLLGFHGRPEEVLSRVTKVPQAKVTAGETIERSLARRIFWRGLLLGTAIAVYLLPSGPITSAMLIGGLWLFFKGQTARWPEQKWIPALVFSMVLFGAHTLMRQVGECQLELTMLMGVNMHQMLTPAQPAGPVRPAEIEQKRLIPLAAVGGVGVVAFFAPAIAAAVYVRLRRVQRDKALRDATLIAGRDPERYLETLHAALDYRFADVGFHLKYAEALVAGGWHADAAVEARLILEQDPYNFSGNLLLANTYYSLGLFDDCAAVCDAYLAVSGYCFEFAELRDQCRRKEAAG